MEKVSRDIAIEEVNQWLDKKKVLASKREAYKDHIDILAEAISEGLLILSEDGVFTQFLSFPLEGEIPVKELKFKSRLSRKMVVPHLNGIKAGDGDGRIVAYMAALTGQPKNILNALDSEDSRISDSIAVFFLG